MSLLGNLVTQVATQALTSGNSQQSQGGLGDMLGGMLGGQQQQSNDNGFGMDDILGSVLQSQMGGNSGGAGGLGSILGSVLGGGQSNAGGGKGMLIAALMPIVLGWIQNNGGLSGALSKVQSMGMGSQAQSWMSTERDNENINPNEIPKLFGSQEIQQACQSTGADESEVRQGLASLLPEVMNQLTPKGGLETEEQANSEISDILKQLSAVMPK